MPTVPTYFYSWEFEADDSLFDWIFMSAPDLPMEGGEAEGKVEGRRKKVARGEREGRGGEGRRRVHY